MPQRHLPKWREEDERAFVHCDSSGLNHAITSNWVCHRAFQSVIRHFIVTSCKCSWQWLAHCCLGLYLISNCHGVQMPAHPPLSILANAAVKSSGTCHCYSEWRNFPVYTIPILVYSIIQRPPQPLHCAVP